MQRTTFVNALSDASPPAECSVELAAIWYLKTGSWQQAQDLIDGHSGKDAAWVRALLYRMAGDAVNANYWYIRAGREQKGGTLGQELALLLDYFLEEG